MTSWTGDAGSSFWSESIHGVRNQADTLQGGGGNDILDGGGGQDVAVFAGKAADYRIAYQNGWLTVTDLNPADGDDGIDALQAIETLRFDDRDYALTAGTGEFRVNTQVVNQQQWSTAAPLTDGGYIVTWTSSVQDGDQFGVFAQRYGATGAPVGNEFQVNTTTAGSQKQPVIAGLASGGFVIGWIADDPIDHRQNVMLQRFSAAGTKLGGEASITGKSWADLPAIVATPSGFLATWTSDISELDIHDHIYAQRYSLTGAKLGAAAQVSTTTGLFRSQTLAPLRDGGFVVAWNNGNFSTGDATEVLFQVLSPQGTKVGSETRANTTTANFQQNPAATPLADGGFVISWESQFQDSSAYGIYAQRFNDKGTKVGSEFRINTYTASDQAAPAMATLKDGNLVAAWASYFQDGSYWGVYGQRYAADGTALGGEFKISTRTWREQQHPTVVALADGGFVVSWDSAGQDNPNDPYGFGVYAQRYDAQGRPVLLELRGTASADVIRAGTGDQRLTALDGNDLLLGGEGADLLDGGDGVDTASFEDAAGAVQVSLTTGAAGGAGGIDTLLGIENLIGSSSGDTLTGNGGANRLDGRGGIDTLIGGAGDDTYGVDNSGDRITEDAAGGTDLVESSATFSLAITRHAQIENLTLIGMATVSGTGNAKANVLTGNSANNKLYGLAGDDSLNGGAGNDTLDGGEGVDRMVGGAGNDTYVVDNPGDSVIESAAGGTDRVMSAGGFSLTSASRAEIENLTLTGGLAANATGNAKGNQITGNTANNILQGMAGNDTLAGGLGADKFKFATVADGLDTITDFTVSEGDKLVFVNANFGALPVGALAANRFVANATGLAGNRDVRFIFETGSRTLRFDPDGSDPQAAVEVVTLSTGSLTASDITIATG